MNKLYPILSLLLCNQLPINLVSCDFKRLTGAGVTMWDSHDMVKPFNFIMTCINKHNNT